MILRGDCLDVMPTLPADSVDAIVTDPPYGLAFMGKDWDHGVPGVHFWQEALRVAKPGASLVAFGGTRTHHRLMVAIEDAGWEIRDTLMWLYGSGFPKSLDVSKAIDKAAGATREVVGRERRPYTERDGGGFKGDRSFPTDAEGYAVNVITAPATDAAKQWDGWGTALKPAWEPIILARKPLAGTVAQNVLTHGVGGLNIDGCRIGFASDGDMAAAKPQGRATTKAHGAASATPDAGRNIPRIEFAIKQSSAGRWPANLLLDEDSAALLDAQTGNRRSAGDYPSESRGTGESVTFGKDRSQGPLYADSGGASRFFYCSKASKKDRGAGNSHPTVKPTDLMRWLVRLVCPPGGVVLDPFAGSGTTGMACAAEGMQFTGIEITPEYADIAERRHGVEPAPAVETEPVVRQDPTPDTGLDDFFADLVGDG